MKNLHLFKWIGLIIVSVSIFFTVGMEKTVNNRRLISPEKKNVAISNRPKLPEGHVKTPPMGWNSWGWFGKQKINAKIVRSVIDSMASDGLEKVGYKYIIVDGGWRANTLDPDGKLKSNQKFPGGMKSLAEYAHSKGFKFGLHTVPGTNDCGGDPVGGFGHEKVQLQEFVNWGVDFIKLDKCIYKPGWTEKLVEKTYLKWKRLIDKSGRNIVLDINAYKFRKWYPGNCLMARTTPDIKAKVNGGANFQGETGSVMYNAVMNNGSAAYAGNGYYNAPDMLPLGNQGLTLPEQKVTFALWCIMTSPLFLGNDPRHMSPEVKAIVTNEEAIAIDQDPTEQGTRIEVRGNKEIWAKQLKDGSEAVLMINRSRKHAMNITLPFIRLGFTGKVKLKDIYMKKDMGTFTGSYTGKIQPQSGLFLLVTRINQ